MKRRLALLCLLIAAVGRRGAAQEQTGGPPGVPVPPPPAAPATAGPGGTAVQHIFQVRLVDGRNGLPLAKAHVTLWYDEPAGEGIVMQMDERGTAAMPAPVGLPIRVLLALRELVDCRKLPKDAPPHGYNLQAIAQRGISVDNSCGAIAVKPVSGEIVLYARPMRWYEGLNR